MNSGIRRKHFLGVSLGAAISGGPLSEFGNGVVIVVLGVLAGNSGTWASLLHARLVTWCGLLVMCTRLLLRIIMTLLLVATRRLSLTLQLVL